MSIAALLLLSIGASCAEPPERRELELCVDGEGGVGVRLEVRFEGPQGEAGSALDQRLTSSRRALEDGNSPWSSRFAALGPAHADGLQKVRVQGQLQRFERWAFTEDGTRLSGFFADTPLQVFSQVSSEVGLDSALFFIPSAGDLAGPRERRRVEEAFSATSAALVEYLDRVRELYESLESLPAESGGQQLRERVLASLLGDALEEPTRLPEPPPALQRRVEAVHDAEEELFALFDVPADEAYSLQESSRRVFDPFPADLRVHVPGRVRRATGFVRDGDSWRVRRVGLWDAVRRLEGRWVSPDPLFVRLERAQTGGAATEGSVLPTKLESRPVVEGEVREALWNELAPWEEYSLHWISDPEASVCEGWLP